MSIDTTPTLEEDTQTVNEAVLAGRPIPPDVLKRVDERGAELRRRMIEQYGVQNIGVSLIRQARESSH